MLANNKQKRILKIAPAMLLIFLMTSSIFVVFSAPTAIAQATPTTTTTQTPWTMFGYNELRYRANKADLTAPSTGHILWKAQTGGSVESSPAINFGMAYVGSDDGCVYAFDEQTGAQIWKYQTGSFVYSSPAAVNLSATDN